MTAPPDHPAPPPVPSRRSATTSMATMDVRLRRRHAAKWSLAATVMAAGPCLAWWWPAAWAPVLLALILLTTLVAMVAVDRRAHRSERRRAESGRPARWTPAYLRERIAVAGAAVLVLAMAAMSTVLAAWLLDDRDVAIGAYAGFLLMAFLGLPFWILGLAEEVNAAGEPGDGSNATPRG